jgi:hypothetical protein
LRTFRLKEGLRRDFSGSVRSGVNGMPTYFTNGHRQNAEFELQTLAAAIQRAIRLQKSA